MAIEDLLTMIPFVGNKLAEKTKGGGKTAEIDTANMKSVENELPFEYIKDNILKVKSGCYRAYARTNAISLNDMGEEDQDTHLSGYADYLNGITKPIQIYIPSFNLDIRHHIAELESRLEEEDNENIREWLEDDMAFQKSLLEENDIIDTHFYFVFQSDFKPSGDEHADYLKAKKMLSKAVKFASDELEGLGLHLKPLDSEGIGKLLYYSLNPFSVGKQEPDFSESLFIESEKLSIKRTAKALELDGEDAEEAAEVKGFKLSKRDNQSKQAEHLRKGSMTFKQKIAPYSINDRLDPDYIKIGPAYMTTYEIYDYSKQLPRLWAKKLYGFRNNIDISIHINPIKTSEVVKELDRAAVNFGAATLDDYGKDKKKAVTMMDKKMESTSQDIGRALDILEGGEESYFHYSHLVMVKAKDAQELADICTELENILGSMRVLFRKTSENMKNALWTVMPFGLDYLGSKRSMLTSGVANGFPFTNFNFTHPDGAFLGTHKYSSNFVHFNPFSLDNANGNILGTSGAGKTTTLYQLEKEFALVKKIPIRVIDPEGEQCRRRIINGVETSFAESIGGEVIDYFTGSKHKINVLEPEPDDEVESLLKPQTNFAKMWLKKILPDLQPADIVKLDYSLIYLYNKFGFTDDKDTYWDDSRKEEGRFFVGRPRRKPPELFDLYNIWFNEPQDLKDVIGETKHLANQLREWTRLGTNDLFDGQTNVDFKNPRLFFNLKHLDKILKGPAVMVLYQKLWDLARQNPSEEKILITDEAHVLLRDNEMGEYVYEINKRIRKYGGGNIFSTQNVTDFLKTVWGPEIIKNCSWSILLKQNKLDVDILQGLYEMTRSEAVRMTRFNRDKGEAYLVADKYRIPINVRLSEKLRVITTTKTKELKEQLKQNIG